MTNLEWSCNNGDEILKAIAYVQINKTEIGKVFEPTPVNEEDVHKILRSVVLADPNAAKLPAEFAVQFPAKQGSRTDAEITAFDPSFATSEADEIPPPFSILYSTSPPTSACVDKTTLLLL